MTPEFEKTVREIWQQHRHRNILTQALGPDPVLFAHDVIAAWEQFCNDSVTIPVEQRDR